MVRLSSSERCELTRLTDTKLIKDEILNILVAGRDTTSTTSSFVTYFLAMHPQVFEKARAEVLATLGTSRPPTSSDIKAMSYLRAVVNGKPLVLLSSRLQSVQKPYASCHLFLSISGECLQRLLVDQKYSYPLTGKRRQEPFLQALMQPVDGTTFQGGSSTLFAQERND